jgi:hypothetical protein
MREHLKKKYNSDKQNNTIETYNLKLIDVYNLLGPLIVLVISLSAQHMVG